jgi:hypothetical protein
MPLIAIDRLLMIYANLSSYQGPPPPVPTHGPVPPLGLTWVLLKMVEQVLSVQREMMQSCWFVFVVWHWTYPPPLPKLPWLAQSNEVPPFASCWHWAS